MGNDVLISIPLFVFMGYLVERANLIEKLFKSLHLALARVPGSLAVATLVTCAVFATATGIVGAVVTLMGLLALPQMLRAGYSVQLSAGAITAGGCLGILIPPSVLLIVYGATAGVSVVQLYAGAFFPGLMLAGLYIVYVIIVAKLKPRLAPPLSAAERFVPLPPLTQRRSPTAWPARALPALLRALKGRRNAGVPTGYLLRQLFIALLPAAAVRLAIAVLSYAASTTRPRRSRGRRVRAAADRASRRGGRRPPRRRRAGAAGETGGLAEPPTDDGGLQEPPAPTACRSRRRRRRREPPRPSRRRGGRTGRGRRRGAAAGGRGADGQRARAGTGRLLDRPGRRRAGAARLLRAAQLRRGSKSSRCCWPASSRCWC